MKTTLNPGGMKGIVSVLPLLVNIFILLLKNTEHRRLLQMKRMYDLQT